MRVWVDGVPVAAGHPVFAPTDRGAILGDGVFETVRVIGSGPVFLDEHVARMGRAARALALPFDEAAVREAVSRACRAAPPLAALRVTLTRGSGGRGLAPIPPSEQSPRLVVTLAPVPPTQDAPVRLHLSRIRRNPSAPSCRHKTLSYADNVAARTGAARAGAEDAVMLGSSGRAACTSIANLWARTPDGFVTPPLSEGALAGVVRQRLLRAGRAGDVPVRVASIDRQALLACPLYRSNSLLGVQRAFLPGGAEPSADNPLRVLYERLEEDG